MSPTEEKVLRYLNSQKPCSSGEIFIATPCYEEVRKVSDENFAKALKSLSDSGFITVRGNKRFNAGIPCYVDLTDSGRRYKKIARGKKREVHWNKAAIWIPIAISIIGLLVAVGVVRSCAPNTELPHSKHRYINYTSSIHMKI